MPWVTNSNVSPPGDVESALARAVPLAAARRSHLTSMVGGLPPHSVSDTTKTTVEYPTRPTQGPQPLGTKTVTSTTSKKDRSSHINKPSHTPRQAMAMQATSIINTQNIDIATKMLKQYTMYEIAVQHMQRFNLEDRSALEFFVLSLVAPVTMSEACYT
eukprot:518745-Rhodomonas_salina.2